MVYPKKRPDLKGITTIAAVAAFNTSERFNPKKRPDLKGITTGLAGSGLMGGLLLSKEKT